MRFCFLYASLLAISPADAGKSYGYTRHRGRKQHECNTERWLSARERFCAAPHRSVSIIYLQQPGFLRVEPATAPDAKPYCHTHASAPAHLAESENAGCVFLSLARFWLSQPSLFATFCADAAETGMMEILESMSICASICSCNEIHMARTFG